ncbi:MAG: hypothetical protein A2085_01310 [Gemmatimonadetes bacterium GWC2_71_10]|nr:MAG: hypothetical protein A2085_01310 [Gemmatimonadetes bacterium GWC2_71_10]
MTTTRQSRGPDGLKERLDAITCITDGVCHECLTGEYAVLSRELAAVLARKRPSPLMRAHVKTWACAIVYTIGSVNFLFDPSQQPHLLARDLCARFGVSQSAGATRSREIMTLLRIGPLDLRWSLPSTLPDNPLAWMVAMNGAIVDVRMMPREIQEEAYALGLIPLLPENHNA